MPHTQNQFDRLVAIHNKLSTGQSYTFEELRKACEIDGKVPSIRTVHNDLKRLREEFDAPIPEKGRSPRPYRYTKPFSPWDLISPEDAALAKEINSLWQRVSQLNDFAGLDDVFLKLQDRAGVVGQAEKPVVAYEQNQYYKGRPWLKPIYEAIRQKHLVKISYVDFEKQAHEFEFSPYFLKEYKNRWHVFGWNHTDAFRPKELLNLALDRIAGLLLLPNLTSRPDSTDWDEYFADIVGFTRRTGVALERFVVRVWYPRANYVLTKPIHGSQNVIQEGTTGEQRYVDLSFELYWNLEFEAALFELGPDAELIQPAPYRARMATKAIALAARYTRL